MCCVVNATKVNSIEDKVWGKRWSASGPPYGVLLWLIDPLGADLVCI